jgi:hypothetical protein
MAGNVNLLLPALWFGRETGQPHIAVNKVKEEEKEEQKRKKAMTAVQAIAMGSCSESHRQAWTLFWYERFGVSAAGQEGSIGWWGGTVDSGTAVSSSLRGSLVTDFKLLVACHLWGRHLVGFIKSQPGGIMGIMEADVGQGKLGIPSDHFFQLLRVILAQAGLYVGAVGHL